MSFWEHHLPWAQIKILQNPPQIKRKDEAVGADDIRGHGCAC